MYRRHNYEERLNIVSRILSGEPVDSICKELRLDRKMVVQWRLRYQKYGEEGLRGTRSYRYSSADKSDIVKEFTENGVSLQGIVKKTVSNCVSE